MSMPTFSRCCSLAVVILLAACQEKANDPFGESGKAAERIDCAVGGAAAFARVCAIERIDGPGGLILTIRHPDGGFRRLRVTSDGRGVAAADGSEPVTVGIAGNRQIEVTLGRDRYRLPATVKRSGA